MSARDIAKAIPPKLVTLTLVVVAAIAARFVFPAMKTLNSELSTLN